MLLFTSSIASLFWGFGTGIVFTFLTQFLFVLLLRSIASKPRSGASKLTIPESAKDVPVCESISRHGTIETATWLNQIVERVFTELREHHTIERVVIEKLNSEFLEISKKTHKLVNRLKVKAFSIGNHAPSIRGTQVMASSESPIPDLNVVVNLTYIGMMNLTLETTLQLPAIGAINVTVKITIQEISGKLSLHITSPDQSTTKLSISFSEPPVMNFDVESLIGDRNRALVEAAIVRVLKTVIGKVLVAPNSKTLTLKGVVEEKKKTKKTDVLAHLHIKVIEAKNLAAADKNGFSDPYVRIRVQRQVKQTNVLHMNLNPVWNETFAFDITEPDPLVTLEVYDHDRLGKGDFLGEIYFQLSSITPTNPDEPESYFRKTEALNARPGGHHQYEVRGTLIFEVAVVQGTDSSPLASVDLEVEQVSDEEEDPVVFVPGKGVRNHKQDSPKILVLGITVVEGSNLMAADSNGFSDPYCKVSVGLVTKKTSIIKKTLNPIWHAKMVFHVKNRMEDVVFSVYDWDLGKADDFLGYASLPIPSLTVNTVEERTLPLKKRAFTDEDVKGTISLVVSFEHIYAADLHRYETFYTSSAYTPPETRLTAPSDTIYDEHEEQPDEVSDSPPHAEPSASDQSIYKTHELERSISNSSTTPKKASHKTDDGDDDDDISLRSVSSNLTTISIDAKGNKTTGFLGHSFVSTHFTQKNANCMVCGKTLKGLFSNKGYQCKDCNFRVHKKCYRDSSKCKGQPLDI